MSKSVKEIQELIEASKSRKYMKLNDSQISGNLLRDTTSQWFGTKGEERKRAAGARTAQRNEDMYRTGTIILRSPGNDLLDLYDREMLKLDPGSKAYSAIIPSEVFHYRFRHEYPDIIFDKSKNYGRWSYLRDQFKDTYVAADKTYWAQVYYSRFKWLVDAPHMSVSFTSKKDLGEYIYKNIGQKSFSDNISVMSDTPQLKMFWRGKLAGHIIEYIPG